MFLLQVAVEDDFTGSQSSVPPANSHQFEMNPQQSSQGPGVASYGPGAFYQGPPGASFPGPGGGPGAYPGPMSPYGGGPGPMSPYQPPNGAGGSAAAAMYGNQNSPLYNQNQSSQSGHFPGSGGPYSSQQAPGSFPGGPGPSSMQSYYNNHSPTQQPPGQYTYGVGPSPVRLSPPPMNMMGLGARIPQPTMNSPNQNNVVTQGGNTMKTAEQNLDLNKQQQGYCAPVTQGFSGPGGGYGGYNGHYSQVPTRPLVSPMSPQHRLNISPGGPNLSPREPLYPGGQPSPGPGYTGGYQAQYSEYFSKHQSQGHSPLSSGSGGYGGGNSKEEKGGYQGDNGSTQGDKMSDAQSNAGSVRSSEGGPGGGETPGCEEQNTGPSLTALTSAKEKAADKTGAGDSDIENKFTPKSEPDDSSSAAAVKTEPGSYFDEHKDFTLKANQTLIDNMNMDSIPELPEIPELKYEDMSEMRRLGGQHPGDSEAVKKETPPGLSPDLKEAQGVSRGWGEEGAETEEGYMGGWGGHSMPGQGRRDF